MAKVRRERGFGGSGKVGSLKLTPNPMAQVLNLLPRPPPSTSSATSSYPPNGSRLFFVLPNSTSCNGGRFTCLFSGNHRSKQDQARKALESALGGKKKELENWDKEIKKREERGGGANGGGGGWFGWFGGFDGDHFWQETQQASLAVLVIFLVFLTLAKGDVMFAVIFNPLLFALRGTRNVFTLITSRILQMVSPGTYPNFENTSSEDVYTHNSAKETVVKKWGSD